MIDALVPPNVVTSETEGDRHDIELFPEEEASLGAAVDKRRREFVTGRACARQALERLGFGPVPIASGEHGEPIWPQGVVGSITHCAGYRACAVAPASEVWSLGIDAEPNEPLGEQIFDAISSARERRRLAGLGGEVALDRVLFCAKEAIYKTWFPLMRTMLDFDEVDMLIDVGARTFTGRLLIPRRHVNGRALTDFRGRWLADDRRIVAAVVLSHDYPDSQTAN